MSDAAYQEFLELLVKGIVNNPDSVKVSRSLDERGVLLTLSVDPKDMGLIIGKQGGTAKAIRTLLRIVGIKNDARVNLKIEEPEGLARPFRPTAPVESAKPDSTDDSVDSIDQVVEDLKV